MKTPLQIVPMKVSQDIFLNRNLSGEAHALLGAFRKQAKSDGWSDDNINKVLDHAKDGDYNHLMQVLMAHCP